MRVRFIMLASVALACASARADFTWGNSATNRITYASGGTNFIAGNKTNASVGCFVQLIFAGANGTNDHAVNSGTGVTNDDAVVSNFWMGANLAGADGYTAAPDTFTNDVSGVYFVRVWSAPALDITNGLVPMSPTNFYGDSRLFTNPLTEPPGFPPEFNFGGAAGFATTVTPGITDTDGDGMPDWWESQFFGNATSVAAGADAEPDGQGNLNEFRAGTDPTNAASVFQLVAVSATNGNAYIQWSSVTGKVYDVSRGTNLFAGFTGIASNIAAAPSVNIYTDAVGSTPYFYRVDVQY